MRVTPYVLVIHGTFAAPEAEQSLSDGFEPDIGGKQRTKPHWYQPEGSFCLDLERELATSFDIRGALWRSVSAGINRTPYSWSGENEHSERLKAAQRLADAFNEIVERDASACIYVVAHSHGGNVVLRAIELYLTDWRFSQEERAKLREFREEFDRIISDAVSHGADVENIDVMQAISDTQPLASSFRGASSPSPSLVRILTQRVRLIKKYQSFLKLLERIGTTFGKSRFSSDWAEIFVKALEKNSRSIAGQWAYESRRQSLGNFIFLGTPFLRKQWSAPSSKIRSVIAKIIRSMTSLPLVTIIVTFGMIIWYYLLLVFPARIILYAIDRFADFTVKYSAFSFIPFEWPAGIWAALLGLGAFGSIGTALTDAPHNTNVYFDEGINTIPLLEKNPALVVSAGLRDEALLALSSEEVIEAQFVPKLREMFNPQRSWLLYRLLFGTFGHKEQMAAVADQNGWWSSLARRAKIGATKVAGGWSSLARRAEIGATEVAGGGGWSLLGRRTTIGAGKLDTFGVPFRIAFTVSMRLVTYCFLPIWYPISRWILEPMITRIVMTVANAQVYGLPAAEVRGARLEVSARIGIDNIFREEFFDVYSANKSVPSSSVIPTDKPGFHYLTDDEAFNIRKKQEEQKVKDGRNFAWRYLVEALPTNYRRYVASFSNEPSKRTEPISWEYYQNARLRVWLTVVDRVRGIDWVHSQYYSNPEIIRKIASFIANGTAADIAGASAATAGGGTSDGPESVGVS